MTTLSDAEIRSCIQSGGLVRNGDEEYIGPACYELRMGTVYYDLTESDRPIDASAHKKVLIKPGHRVVLITLEELEIPDNIIARVASKGSLFSIGLSPVSTYADPGFAGNIGIVTQNISDKYIEIPIGEPIAKVDFSLVSGNVNKPYQGQHGFKTKIWPIKYQLQKTYSDVKDDPRVQSEEIEAYKVIPAATARILQKLQRRQRRVDMAIIATIFINTCMLYYVAKNPTQAFEGVLVNLISSALIGAFVWFNKD
jgi:dCTP deaminase